MRSSNGTSGGRRAFKRLRGQETTLDTLLEEYSGTSDDWRQRFYAAATKAGFEENEIGRILMRHSTEESRLSRHRKPL